MKITFIGATHEVTGSCYYLEAAGKKFLVDCGMEQGPDYYENKDVLRKISKNYWTATFSNEEFTQFYLITQIDSNINSIKDISNKKISLELYDKEPEVWINKLTLLNNKKSIESISSKIIKEGKESTVLLNVFFKKTDLAVVSSETWDDMIKLNPSISKKLKII